MSIANYITVIKDLATSIQRTEKELETHYLFNQFEIKSEMRSVWMKFPAQYMTKRIVMTISQLISIFSHTSLTIFHSCWLQYFSSSLSNPSFNQCCSAN